MRSPRPITMKASCLPLCLHDFNFLCHLTCVLRFKRYSLATNIVQQDRLKIVKIHWSDVFSWLNFAVGKSHTTSSW